MAKNYSEIVIGLAGICQASSLVRQLAQTGYVSEKYQNILFKSLTQLNPSSALDVYGNDINNIKLGLEGIKEMLGADRRPETADMTRYSVSMTVLERKLMASSHAQNQLRQRINHISSQVQFFQEDDEQLVHNLAGIYVDVISPLGQKIRVTGSEPILMNPLVQSKARALLLSGVRAAVLWQQVGGSRWQILFSRKKLIDTAQQLLNTI